jgi:hypothetical protein
MKEGAKFDCSAMWGIRHDLLASPLVKDGLELPREPRRLQAAKLTQAHHPEVAGNGRSGITLHQCFGTWALGKGEA